MGCRRRVTGRQARPCGHAFFRPSRPAYAGRFGRLARWANGNSRQYSAPFLRCHCRELPPKPDRSGFAHASLRASLLRSGTAESDALGATSEDVPVETHADSRQVSRATANLGGCDLSGAICTLNCRAYSAGWLHRWAADLPYPVNPGSQGLRTGQAGFLHAQRQQIKCRKTAAWWAGSASKNRE